MKTDASSRHTSLIKLNQFYVQIECYYEAHILLYAYVSTWYQKRLIRDNNSISRKY